MRPGALILVGCFALVTLGGCAWTSHTATLNPTVNVVSSAVGGGQPVEVEVVDERPRNIIGRRGAGGQIGATITIDQDLEQLVREQLEEGLQKNGFAIAGEGDGREASSMKVEIRAFEYVLVMGFWTGSAQTNATMKAICRNGDETYEELFRTDHKRGAYAIPTGSKTDRILNEALSEILEKILQDQPLLRCLAQ